MTRITLIAALAVPVLLGQGNPRIAISAPKNFLIVGESMPLSVTVRDANGAVMANPPVTWSSTNTGRIQIDGQGRVTAVGIGSPCSVAALSGGFRAGLDLQCIPLRIDLKPEEKDVAVGEELQFEARAVNLQGEAIPNPGFNWQVTGANGNQINAARITQTGLLTAVGTGLITVRARITFPAAPGRIDVVWGESTVRVTPRRFYRVRRLISSDEVRHSFTIRPAQRWSAINENGQVAFNASLDGLAEALLAYDRGTVSMITQGGAPFFAGVLNQPNGVAMNNRGDILARAGNDTLMLAAGGETRFLLLSGQSFGGIENMRGMGIFRGSLNDLGDVVFSAGFTRSGVVGQRQGIFRMINRRLELLAADDGDLPGLGPNWQLREVATGADGAVHFVAWRPNDPATIALFRIIGPGVPERVLGAEHFPEGLNNMRELRVGKDSSIALAVDPRGRNSQIVQIRGSQRSSVDAPGLGSIYQVLDGAGVLFHSCASDGCGVRRWKDGVATMLLRQGRLAPNDEPITRIDNAAISPAGVLTALVATAENDLVLIQPGATPGLLLQAGQRIDLTARIHLPPGNTLIRGAPNGPLYLNVSNGNTFELDNGAIIPRLMQGDRLPDGGTVPNGVAGSPTGDLYFADGPSLYRFRDGQAERIIPAGTRLADGSVLENVQFRAANSTGAIAFTSNARPPSGPVYAGLYLFESGRTTEVARTGTTFRFPFDTVELDDAGRVAYRLPSGTPQPNSLLLWSGDRSETLLEAGPSRIGSMTLVNFSNPRGRGDRFYIFGNVPGSNDQALLELGSSGPQLAVTNYQSMPDGATNFGIGAWDANSRGDLVFVTQAGSPLGLMVRIGNEIRQVHSMLAPTPEGDQITQINEINVRDDGRIYFGAIDVTGRYSIYVAEPIDF